MTTIRTLRHAAMLVAGVLLFAFGASRMLSGPAQQITQILDRQPVQVVTVDE